MHNLRPYQREAIDAAYAHWAARGGNALIELATGTGKSLVVAALCKELLAKWPDLRIGVITHVKELIAQNAQEMIRCWPQAPIGIYSAGLNRRDARAQILFCGIQSVWGKAPQLGGFDLLLIDEAHTISRSGDTMYGKFFENCRAIVPDMRILGLTATPFRLDSGRLDEGDGAMFTDTIYQYGIARGVKDGFLSPLVSKATRNQIDLTNVHIRGGEYIISELEDAALDEAKIAGAVNEMLAFGEHRQAWLAFCAGVKHARAVASAIAERGVTVEVVTGETPAGERNRIITAYREGRIRCLTSVGVLTTGFNAPQVDLIACLRPTLSAGLYVQMLGRGTRIAPGKIDCLVLDFAGLTRQHGPVDAICVRTPGKGYGVAPVKECPDCSTFIHASLALCPVCAHVFPRELKHVAEAATAPVMAIEPPKWLGVKETSFRRHARNPEKPPTLCVTYYCGVGLHRRWVCFEHAGFPRRQAENWWAKAGGDTPCPATIDEALKRITELRRPSQIMVRPSGKFFEVVAEKFSHELVEADDTA